MRERPSFISVSTGRLGATRLGGHREEKHAYILAKYQDKAFLSPDLANADNALLAFVRRIGSCPRCTRMRTPSPSVPWLCPRPPSGQASRPNGRFSSVHGLQYCLRAIAPRS